MNCTTQMQQLEQENIRLKAQVGALTKQTNGAVCVSPFILLAKEFLGNTHKVDRIKKGIRTLTEPAELLSIQQECAVQLKLLQDERSRCYWPTDGLIDIRRERWSRRYDILVSEKSEDLRWTGITDRMAIFQIPHYNATMNVDEMLELLGKDPNRTFVYTMNEDYSPNVPIFDIGSHNAETMIVLKYAVDCIGEQSSLLENTLSPPVDTETVRSNAPWSGCSNDCPYYSCRGRQENYRLRRFDCHHFCCESFTDYCVICDSTYVRNRG